MPRRGRKREPFASLNYPLLVFCALAVVVNFSVSFCCHVRFPVDHALLLPPPNSLLTSVSSLLSHTLLCLCGFAPMGGSSRRRPLIGWPQKACEDWRNEEQGGEGGSGLGVRAEWRWSAWVFLFCNVRVRIQEGSAALRSLQGSGSSLHVKQRLPPALRCRRI